jgi:flagellar biosynthesis GTPase FlhF
MSAAAVVENRRAMNETKTFRGSSLEEVLPKIKADLGPDAEIVRQREGLTGGVGGFFQRACIEVDARAAEPSDVNAEPAARRFDAYDDSPAMPEPLPAFEPREPFEAGETDEPTAEGLTAPGIQEILRQAAPFADHLDAAARRAEPLREPDFEPFPEIAASRRQEPVAKPEPVFEPEPAAAPEPVRQPPVPSTQGARPQIANAIEQQLVEAGLGAPLAQEIVAETVSHVLPFGSPRRLRKLVRQGLASRIPIARIPAGGGRSLAFVGPGGSGKTLCAARVATAYANGSDLPVVCVTLQPDDGGAELRSLVEPHGVGVTVAGSAAEARAHIAGALGHAVIVVDTPSAVSAADLETIGVHEVHLTLPSLYSGLAAAELSERLPSTHIALTHLDESTRIGGLVDFLMKADLPLSFVSKGAGGLEPADALDLAGLVLS